MNILLAVKSVLPAIHYGGTQRVVYCLGRELRRMGHDVTFLANPGSSSDFASVIEIDSALPLERQIPEGIDIVHYNNYTPKDPSCRQPSIVTFHGNGIPAEEIGPNSVFVSRDHALRHGCDSFVYNGLDWNDYGPFDPSATRGGFHFLGNAAWRVKNVRGAIDVVTSLKGETLEVMGGRRFNFKMGVRLTFSPRVHFHGMVDDAKKRQLINRSKGLVFPVTWHEPFGLCITESMYFGSPVFGTPYGSLPELVTPDTGGLTADAGEMARMLVEAGSYDPRRCHEYAADCFNSRVMAEEYLIRYERVLSGEQLIKSRTPMQNTWRGLPWH